jgi:hypothetical protein
MPDQQHTPARLNCPATASFHTSDPFPMLRTAEFDAITTAEELQLAAQTMGKAAAQIYLFAVALRIRSVLPTAHQSRCRRARKGATPPESPTVMLTPTDATPSPRPHTE